MRGLRSPRVALTEETYETRFGVGQRSLKGIDSLADHVGLGDLKNSRESFELRVRLVGYASRDLPHRGAGLAFGSGGWPPAPFGNHSSSVVYIWFGLLKRCSVKKRAAVRLRRARRNGMT